MTMITNAGLQALRCLEKERATAVLRVDKDKSNKYMNTLHGAITTIPRGTRWCLSLSVEGYKMSIDKV